MHQMYIYVFIFIEYFIYISNVIHFSCLPFPEAPYAFPCPTASMTELSDPSTHSHLPALAFAYIGALKPQRPKNH